MINKFIDIERLIHSIKTGIACLLGFLIAKLIGLRGDQWVVITIIVLMCAQIYVGSVLQKAYLRLLGTFIGCFFATFTLMSFGASTLSISIAIALTSFIFSYVATSRENLAYAGTLGAVTTAIILMNPSPTTTVALERFIEISIGILVAMITSQFVLPIHARTHLRRTQANTFEKLRDYYTDCMVNHGNIESIYYQDRDEDIVKSLLKQRQLAKEAMKEPLGKLYDPLHFMQVLQKEKEILRYIGFMHHAIIKVKNFEKIFHSPVIKLFNETILKNFEILIIAIQQQKKTNESVIAPSLKPLIETLPKDSAAQTDEELIALNSLFFSAESLIDCLLKLAELFDVEIVDAKNL